MGKASPRIEVSGPGSGGQWHPELTEEHQKTLEAAYGVAFVNDSWDELQKHLFSYAVWAARESSAAPVPQLQLRLSTLQKASEILLDAIIAADAEGVGYAMNRVVDEKWEELFHGEARNDEHWFAMEADVARELALLRHSRPEDRAREIVGAWRGQRWFPDPIFTDDLRDRIYEMQHAISRAQKSYGTGDEATIEDGDAWRELVQGLARWADAYRFPRKVSKDVDDVSSFIRFIAALQELMPTKYRRHTQSLPALASAVSRALTKVKGKRVK